MVGQFGIVECRFIYARLELNPIEYQAAERTDHHAGGQWEQGYREQDAGTGVVREHCVHKVGGPRWNVNEWIERNETR